MGFSCVCCASAVSSPHAALLWVLSSAASRTEKQSHSSSKKKTPKILLLPKGKKLLGAPCLCVLQLKFQRSGDAWDVGWEVLLLHCALQWWHTWGKASRVSSVPARLSLDLREDEQLQTGWVVHSPGVWGLCFSPCPHPFLLLPPAATVFLQCWMEHTLLADRGHHPQWFCAQAGVRRH